MPSTPGAESRTEPCSAPWRSWKWFFTVHHVYPATEVGHLVGKLHLGVEYKEREVCQGKVELFSEDRGRDWGWASGSEPIYVPPHYSGWSEWGQRGTELIPISTLFASEDSLGGSKNIFITESIFSSHVSIISSFGLFP